MRGRLLAAALLLACAQAQGLRAAEGFEAGNGAWTAAGLWHRVSAPACVTPHAGAACFYFGRDSACDYADGTVKDASLTSAPVVLSDPSKAFISFWLQYQVESLDPACYDRLRLERSEDGVNWAFLADLSLASDPSGGSPSTGVASGSGVGGPPLWQFRRVDLSAFLGLTLQLRFRFVSSASQAGNNLCGPPDGELDHFLGYALDDVSFGDAAAPLALEKSVEPAFAAPGETFTYTLVATNSDSAPRLLNLWDTLPSGAVYAGSAPAGLYSGGRVDWAFPSVGAGASVTVQLRVQVDPSLAPPVDWLNTADGASTAPGPTVSSAPAFSRVRAAGLSLRKTASKSVATSGDLVTFSLVLANYTALTQSSLALVEELPSAFTLTQALPAFNGTTRWNLGALAPGELRTFSVWGRVYGDDGQTVVNNARLYSASSFVALASAGVSIKKPIEPRISLRAVYPNPAPSDKPGLPQGAFVVYDINQSMPITLDIFTLAGEKVRRLYGPGERGVNQLGWDLNNEWGAAVASGVYAFRLWSTLPVIPTPEAYGFIAVLR